MEILIKHLIIVLATWRVTNLFVNEFGPFNIFYKLRSRAKNTFFEDLLDCVYCSSIWIGFGFALLVGKNLSEIFVLSLFYSAGTILLDKAINE